MSKPRILYIAYDLCSFGGIQRYSRYELRALDELFPTADRRICSYRGIGEGGFEGGPLIDLVGGRSPAARLRFAVRVLRTARAERPDVVICDHIHLGALAWLAARFGGSRLCVNVYGIEAWGRLLPWRLVPLLRATGIVSCCDFTRRILIGRHPELRDRITVVQDCVDVERFTPGPASAELTTKLGLRPGPVLLTVSRLTRGRSKGHDRVLEVLADHLRDMDLTYVIVGDGDDRERLVQRTAELDVADRVRFAGSIADDELEEYYRLCDVFVLVSGFRLGRHREGEGIPLVNLEAQACAKPVITSRLDGSAESITDGETGYLVDPHSTQELATALLRLLPDAAARERMGAAGCELARGHFAYERFVARLATALAPMLEHARRMDRPPHREPDAIRTSGRRSG